MKQIMKTKVAIVVALFLLSLGVTAQIDRTVQPNDGPAPKINLGTPYTFSLKNGMQVMVVENHKLPRVTASLILENGPIFEGENVGVSQILSGMLGNGTTSIPKDEFNEEVDFLGATLNAGSQTASFNTLSKFFPRMLELMADAVQNPLLTQEEFDKQQAQLIEGIKSGENSVENIADIAQYALVYGKNHPYGEFSTEEIASNITLEDVKSFYNNYFVPNNGYLIFIGDVKAKEVKKLVKKYFSKWEKGTLPGYTIPEIKNVEETEINFVNMPNAVQSSVAVMNTVDLKMGHPDYFATRLANKIFGGGGEGRLFMNLREDKGYTYGAYSRIGSDERTATLLKSSASVRNTVTDSAVVEFMKEIKKFRDTKVTDEELKNAKAAYVGNFVMALEKPSTVARYALNIATKNLPGDFYQNYLEKINAVTVDDIQRVAKKYFSHENARIVIVGKAIDVIPNLEKSDYSINYFDKEANKTEKPELTKPIPAGVTKQTVINKYFDAIGGVDKINAVKTVLVTYEGSAMGSTVQNTEKRTSNQYLSEMSMGGNVMMKVIMNKEGVSMNGQPIPPEMSSEMNYTLGTFQETGILNNENSKLTGIENIDGKDMYAITTKGEIVTLTLYFDAISGLKLKEVQTISMRGQTQNQETTFADYKDYNGIKFPTVRSGNMGPQVVSFKLLDAKINEGVSEDDFK